ncbi:hypothetical protein XFF6970_240001 [Xanthomonas citri pv. fuscans]|nr:hypothetical protein XFF6970_240001 [Xanthomonas citri pv. fuscans]
MRTVHLDRRTILAKKAQRPMRRCPIQELLGCAQLTGRRVPLLWPAKTMTIELIRRWVCDADSVACFDRHPRARVRARPAGGDLLKSSAFGVTLPMPYHMLAPWALWLPAFCATTFGAETWIQRRTPGLADDCSHGMS